MDGAETSASPPPAQRTGGVHPSASSDLQVPVGLDGLSDRFPAADGLRAAAAFGVLLTHVGLLSGYTFRNPELGRYFARADVGVSIFFVLSGFLLYRPILVRRFASFGQGDAGRYARRRLLRIFPAYWVALTIVAFVLQAPPFEGGHGIVAHYLLLQIYDPSQVVGGPIDQAWSLATELSFYLFLPVWAWLLSRRVRRPELQLRAECWTLAALWAGCIGLNLAVIAWGVSGPRFGQFGTWLPFRIHEFVFGMGLAVASAWMRHRSIRLPDAWSGTRLTLMSWGAAAVLFWAVATQLDFPLTLDFSPMRALALRVLYSVIGLLAVLPVVLGRQDKGVMLKLLANPVAVWLGLISYGIYIWHKAWQNKYLEWTDQLPLEANFAGMMVATVALTVVAAAASWYLVERPLMRRRDRRPSGATPR